MTALFTIPRQIGPMALCFAMSLAFAAQPARKSFDIPAGPAERALRAFTEQSGLQVGFPTEITQGIRTNAVKGELIPTEAANRLLAGTNLKLVADEKSGVYTVARVAPPEKNVPRAAQATNGDRPSRNRAAAAPVEDETIELNPFVVTSDRDVGYLAAESLSGSRLKTSLRDIPAPVSVFTEELLKDLGANTAEDAVLYGLNAVEFMEIEIGGATGNQMLEHSETLNVNIRGLRASATRNYFNWSLNTDNYNTSRLDVSRGPNAILFGIGTAGGIANVTTKQAQMRDFITPTLQISSYGSYRASLDVNKEIVDDKLAVRLNALKDDQNDWRPVLGKSSERLHVAGTFRPLKYTTLRAEAERGVVDSIKVSPWGPMDGITAWVAAGADDFVATARGAASATLGQASIGGNATTPWLVAIQDSTNPTITDWNRMSRSNWVGAGTYSLFDFTRIPRETVTRGPGSKQDYDYSTRSIWLEQTVGKHLAFQAAYNKQKQDSVWTEVTDWNTRIYVDVNRQRPDGTSNPHAGEFFIEETFQFNPREVEADTLQFTASYDLDSARFVDGIASKLLGRHRLAGLYQEEDKRLRAERYMEVNTTPLPGNSGNASLVHAKNQINRRTYLGSATDRSVPFKTSGAIDPLTLPLSSQAVTTHITGGTTGTVTPGIVRERVNGRETKVDTKLLVLQSYFWDNKVVTTFGYRRDDLKERVPATTAANGVITDYTWDVPFERRPHGVLRTQGGLFHVTDWLSLFYNRSDNFNLGGGQRDPFGELLPNERGEGEDYGLRFRLLDNRVVISLAHYKTSTRNRLTFTGSTGQLRNAANDIWDALADSVNPIYGAAPYRVNTSMSIGTVEDAESDGTELEITGNLTSRWSLTFNASRSDVKVANTGNTDRRYFEAQWNEVWSNFSAVPVAATGNRPYNTVAGAYDWIVNVNHEDRNGIIDNQTQKGHEKYKVKLFTNYRFGGSFLKGFSVGGGAQYYSRPITRSQVNPADNVTIERFHGSPLYLFDLRFGYTTAVMAEKYKLDLRLNIRNLFDKDEYKTITSDSTGAPMRARFVTPRSIAFTSSITF